MFFFGQYEFKAVKEVTGVAYGRFKEWGIEPSIAKADGPGRRNIYSRNDLYLINLYKKIFDAGWDRKTAKSFIDAIKEEKFTRMVDVAQSARLSSILGLIEEKRVLTSAEILQLVEEAGRDESFEGNLLPFLSGTLGKSQDEIRVIYECVAESVYGWDSSVDLLMLFFRDRDLDQFGLISADSYIRQKEPFSIYAPNALQIASQMYAKREIDHLLFGLSVSGDAYIVEFTSIINDVDIGLMEAFPSFVPYEDLAMMLRLRWNSIKRCLEDGQENGEIN
jgi:hypothetical protein